MVAYFRKENLLFSILGGVLGLVFCVLFYDQLTSGVPGYFKLFFLLIPMIFGVVAGRVYAGFWANKKLRQYNALLYTQVEPEEFLKVFTPLVQKTPKDNIAYVDGCNKLSYACEALGCFDEAMDWIEDLEPEKLKLHALGGTAMTCNQQMRLHLLQGNVEAAREKLEQLRNIGEVALVRAPALGKNTMECVRLAENWLAVLEGEPADLEYLLEEVNLSKNRIHKSEMLLVLAQLYRHQGDELRWKESLMEAMSEGCGLYAERKAESLLSEV